MDALRLHDFATRYTAAWCSQHPERVAAFFSPAGSLTVNNGTPAVGRREIIELARSFMTTFPDLRVLMNDLCIHEDSAEYHWTLIGTHRGPEGLGHRVQISGFERWHMAADGLIAASEGHFDAAEYQRQLEQGCS
jgi:SnoaL-like polyketide cyclase